MLGGNQQTHKAEETMTAALNEFPNFVAAHYWSACLFYEPQGRWVEARNGYVKALRVIERGLSTPEESKLKSTIIKALHRLKRHALNV